MLMVQPRRIGLCPRQRVTWHLSDVHGTDDCRRHGSSTAQIRKELKLKKGRIQISSHGCGKYSIQVFLKGKLVQDLNVNSQQLGA